MTASRMSGISEANGDEEANPEAGDAECEPPAFWTVGKGVSAAAALSSWSRIELEDSAEACEAGVEFAELRASGSSHAGIWSGSCSRSEGSGADAVLAGAGGCGDNPRRGGQRGGADWLRGRGVVCEGLHAGWDRWRGDEEIGVSHLENLGGSFPSDFRGNLSGLPGKGSGVLGLREEQGGELLLKASIFCAQSGGGIFWCGVRGSES